MNVVFFILSLLVPSQVIPQSHCKGVEKETKTTSPHDTMSNPTFASFDEFATRWKSDFERITLIQDNAAGRSLTSVKPASSPSASMRDLSHSSRRKASRRSHPSTASRTNNPPPQENRRQSFPPTNRWDRDNHQQRRPNRREPDDDESPPRPPQRRESPGGDLESKAAIHAKFGGESKPAAFPAKFVGETSPTPPQRRGSLEPLTLGPLIPLAFPAPECGASDLITIVTANSNGSNELTHTTSDTHKDMASLPPFGGSRPPPFGSETKSILYTSC